MRRLARCLALFAVASCGDGEGDAAGSAVTVRVLAGGTSRTGVLVVFHDASGAVLETVRTGPDGKARGTGAMVTVGVTVAAGQGVLVTYYGVEPNDSLVVETYRRAQASATPGLPVRTLRVAAPGEFPNARQYAVDAFGSTASCRGVADGWADVTLDLALGCLQANRTHLVARALAAPTDRRPLAYAFAQRVTVTTASATPFAIPGPWAAPMDVDVDVQNAPATMPAPSVGLVGVVGGVQVGVVEPTTPSGTTFAVPNGFHDEHVVEVRGGIAGPGPRYIVTQRGRVSDRVAVDLARLVPVGASIDADDPKRPVVHATGGADTAGGSVAFAWDGSPMRAKWTLVLPPGMADVKAPALPPELEGWLPGATADDFRAGLRAYAARFVVGDAVSDYRALRVRTVFADVVGLVGDELVSYDAPKGTTWMTLFEGAPR